MNKNIQMFFIVLITVIAIGTAFFINTQKNTAPGSPQVSDTVDNWKTYTNNKSTFSIKLPPDWFVHTDIIGNEMVMYYPIDNPSPENLREEQAITMVVTVSQNIERKTIFEEAEKMINEAKSSINKDYKVVNQNYIILTSKDGRFLMTLTHYQTLTYIFIVTGGIEKNRSTIDQILSSFKIIDPATNTDNKSLNYVTAMSILQNVPEIQELQKDIIKLGRTTFFKAGDENGDIVKIWLYEGGFPDNHTTRIDTFNVNIKTKVITVDDVAMISGKEFITLEEWKKTVTGRFQ